MFEQGNTFGKGRPKGSKSGRGKALAILDSICNKTKTQKLFKQALLEYLEKSPLKFYREFVVALAPKQMDIDLKDDVGFATLTPAEQMAHMMESTVGEIPSTSAEK